jgi:hypothetical protein
LLGLKSGTPFVFESTGVPLEFSAI